MSRRPFAVSTRLALSLKGAAVALLAAAGPATADGADIMKRWYADLAKVEGLQVSVGAVTDEPDGRAVTKDLRVGFRAEFRAGITDLVAPVLVVIEGRYEVPFYAITGLEETAEGYKAERVEASNAVTELKGRIAGHPFRLTQTLRTFEALDASWPRLPDVEADSARPVSRFGPAILALLQLSAKEATISGSETEIETPGLAERTVTDEVRVLDIVDGRSQIMTRSDMRDYSLNAPKSSDASESAPISTVRLETMTGHDPTPVVRLVFGMAQPGGRATLLESGIVEDMAGDTPQVRFNARRSAVRNATLGTSDHSIASALDRLVAEGTISTELLAATLADSLDAFALDEAVLSDLEFDRLYDELTGKVLDIPGKLDEYRVVEWNGMSIDSFSMSGMQMRFPTGENVDMDRFALRDISLPAGETMIATATALAAAEAQKRKKDAPPAEATPEPKAEAAEGDIKPRKKQPKTAAPSPLTPRQILDLIPTVGAIEVAGIERTTANRTTTFALKNFTARFGDYIRPIPTKVDVEISGLLLPQHALPDLMSLPHLGVEMLGIDGRLSAAWDEATGDLTVSPFDVTATDIGRYQGSLKLGGVPRMLFAEPDKAQAALPQITFDRAAASFSDAPGMTRYVEEMAADMGMSSGEFVTALVGELRQSVADKAGEAFANRVAAAVRAFLADPRGKIELTARPKAPVPVAAILGSAVLGPGALVTLLNVDVVADRGL